MIDINLEKYPNLILDKQVISVLRWFKNNKIYCIRDYYNKYAPKCFKCKLVITPTDG